MKEQPSASDLEPGSDRAYGALEKLWLGFSSSRTTSLLVVCMALASAMVVYVPQGSEALELARSPDATLLHELIAWGLGDVFGSKWFEVLAVLLLANVVAAALRSLVRTSRADEGVRVPAEAPHRVHLEATIPERAAEQVRDVLRRFLRSAPIAESFQGSRVTLTFEAGRGRRVAPFLAHVGLVLLITGAASSNLHDAASSIPFARVKIKDLATHKVGLFDMEANEPFQIFQRRANYVLRDFVRDKDGLGPAIRFDIVGQGQDQTPISFWVYQLAPVERSPDGSEVSFDERHRGDRIAFQPVEMGLRPLPGQGFAASGGAVWMLLGAGLLGVGVLLGSQPGGRVWAELDGDDVRLTAVPQGVGDTAFATLFSGLAAQLRSTLAEDL